jgi:hypothetical protein
MLKDYKNLATITDSKFIKNVFASSQKVYSKSSELLRSQSSIIASLGLAFLAIGFFIVITNQEFFNFLPFYRTRWFALSIILASFCITYIGAFWNNAITSRWQSYIVFGHSIVLTLFSYGYLIRLNNSTINIFNYQFNTSLVFIPVTLLIFLVNYNIFHVHKHSQLLAVAQVLFIILFTYSIIAFINVDSSFARNFNQGWLTVIFNWPAWLWLIISSVAITFVSGRDIHHVNVERRWIYLLSYYLMNLQILIAVSLLNFSYWYETLLALVSWNFVYTNIYSLMTKKNDTKYRPRLTISIFYHLVLFLIILYVG